MGALDDLAFAMKVLIEVPAYRVAIRHGYLAVVFLLSYSFFIIKTHTKKKDTSRCPFFKSNTWLNITLQRQHLDLYILRLRSPSSLACLGTCQHSQDDGYDNQHSTHVPIHHKSIPLLDYVPMEYQR